MRRIPEVTLGIGIHRRKQHEAGWKDEPTTRAADRDDLIFKRLAQSFERALIELGQLVEKKDTAMSERDFTGSWQFSPADPSRVIQCVLIDHTESYL